VTTSLLFSVLYLGAVIFLHGGPDPLHRFARLLPDMLPWARSRESLPPSEAAPPSPQSAHTDPVAVPESFRRRPEEVQ
jgi:hypothetical protein